VENLRFVSGHGFSRAEWHLLTPALAAAAFCFSAEAAFLCHLPPAVPAKLAMQPSPKKQSGDRGRRSA
jgi:hypothetical protein